MTKQLKCLSRFCWSMWGGPGDARIGCGRFKMTFRDGSVRSGYLDYYSEYGGFYLTSYKNMDDFRREAKPYTIDVLRLVAIEYANINEGGIIEVFDPAGFSEAKAIYYRKQQERVSKKLEKIFKRANALLAA